jgi:hypothetical protein
VTSATATATINEGQTSWLELTSYIAAVAGLPSNASTTSTTSASEAQDPAPSDGIPDPKSGGWAGLNAGDVSGIVVGIVGATATIIAIVANRDTRGWLVRRLTGRKRLTGKSNSNEKQAAA